MTKEDKPFSVWSFHSKSAEGGGIVTWKEEFEDGTAPITIVVRTEEEFHKAVDRFSLRVKGTWPVL